MAQARPPTQPGKLSDTARHVVLPSGIVSTGWPAVRDTCAGFGVEFDPWQDGAGRAILAKRADGTYACSIGGVVISIPRQVGKTFLIGAIVFALCLLHPGLTVIWTAHRLRTADETFASMLAFSRRKKVAPYMLRPVLGAGEEEIRFRNGSRILFGARERGFGRGFANVGVLMFDEAQILSENAIDDMVPATNQAVNPLLIFTGTPPKPSDPSEVFTRKRDEALKGESDDTVYIEFSADTGSSPTDRKQWAKANPSYPLRTNDAAMLRMKKNLSVESFMREAMGIWNPTDVGPVAAMKARWPSLADRKSLATDESFRLALDAPLDMRDAWFSSAGVRKDGLLHVQTRHHVPPVIGQLSATNKPLVDRVVSLAVELTKGHNCALILPPYPSPARSWKADLLAAGVRLDEMTATEYAEARGRILNAANDGALRHRDQPEMNSAVAGLESKPSGDVEPWSRRASAASIAPFVAATCALARVPEAAVVDPASQVW